MESKKKKVVRNKGRDMLADYYKTNKQYTAENEEAIRKKEASSETEAKADEKGKGRPFSANEKLYVIIIVLGLIGIGIRYFVF